MSLVILSVAEQGGNESLTAEQKIYLTQRVDKFRISITPTRKLTMTLDHNVRNGIFERRTVLEFRDPDIDGLIEYLQDVKQYLSEHDLIEKLAGRK